MTPSTPGTHQIAVEEIEYLRHGDKPLLARVFKPQGGGPFPLMVSLHGGAWCRESRMTDEPIHEALAKSGVVVASLDFRMPPDASYPGSMIDINYAIRWLKSRAASLNARADAVGVMGTSSGGHQAMLTAMRPRDTRYASQPLAGAADASVRCAILLWPVLGTMRMRLGARRIPCRRCCAATTTSWSCSTSRRTSSACRGWSASWS